MLDGPLRRKGAGYLAAVLGTTVVTAIGAPFRTALNETTVALAFLFLVLFVAARWGRWPAVVASLLGVLSFDFFFLPPLYTLIVADLEKGVELAAFLAAALTLGEWSARATRHVAEAEAGRTEATKAAEKVRDTYTVLVEGMISAARMAEAEVRSDEARRAATMQASLDAIVTLDARGAITEFNPAAEQMFGRRREDVLGREIADVIIPPSLRDRHRQGMARYLETGVPKVLDRRIELRALRASGEEFPVELVIARIALAGPPQFTGYIRDITERKRAEEAMRRLNVELEERVAARTAQLEKANRLKDELIVREQAAAAELASAREREGQIGFRIQQMLLLTQPPRDLSGLQVAALTIPSQRVDGDFYGFFRHENQSLDVIVADVMGKGVPAALLAAATKTNVLEALCHLTALSTSGALPEPKDIVTLAHADMVGHLIDLESFVTLAYARLDPNRQMLHLVDCGHTGMMVVRAATGRCEILHGDNLPLGIRGGESFSQIAVPFGPGDLFLFYSDGITEMRDGSGEPFGAARLSDCVRLNRTLEPEALVEAIRRDVFAFAASDTPNDDLTCVVIRACEQEALLARAELEIDSDYANLRRVREFIHAFSRDLPGSPVAEDDVAALELAVNEAVVNIMKHAYHGRPGQRIHLELEAFPHRVAVRLDHLGDTFDPSAVLPPKLDGSQESGLGMYLITKSVDDVRFYRDERGRNCIALVKCRKP